MNNEQKIVTVKAVTGNGSFNAVHGTYYAFIYTLENEAGKEGEFHVNHKTPEPKFKVGDKVLFEANGQTPRGDNKAKLKSPDAPPYLGGGNRPRKTENRNGSFALSYAKDIFIAHGAMGSTDLPTPNDVTAYVTSMADDFLKWLNENE